MRNTLRVRGFTLIEILVYIAIIAVVLGMIVSFMLWLVQAQNKTSVSRHVTANAQQAMEIILSEVREADAVYTPTSQFGSYPSQLSLVTKKYAPAGEQSSYIDFYVCGVQVCFKQEGSDAVALTADDVYIQNLIFTPITAEGIVRSIQITLAAEALTSSGKNEYQANIELTSTASLRR